MMNLLGAATALFPIQMTGKSSVFARVVKVISDNPDEFLTALGQHVFNLVLIPVLLAIVIAVPLGILATRHALLEKVFLTIVNILQTIPAWRY